MPAATSVKIVHTALNGVQTVLKEELKLKAGEIIDASVMSVKALRAFYAKEFADAKANGTLVSIHLKATMMKVSDPIIFGHAVSVFLPTCLKNTPMSCTALPSMPKMVWRICMHA